MQHSDRERRPDPRTARVLFAEDQQFIRKALAQVFERAGFAHVDVVPSGEEALEALGQEDYRCDLLLTDIHMGPVSGLHLLQAVRCRETCAPADLPVLLITSESSENAVGAALMLDAHGLLAKPVQPRELFEKVTVAFSRSLSPKPPAAYRLIHLQEVTGEMASRARLFDEKPVPAGAVEPPGRNGKKVVAHACFAVDVPVDELRAGMVLGEPVLGLHGQIMVQKAERLTERQLVAIHRILRAQEKETVRIRTAEEA